jgi:hypothetical protein
MPVPKFKTGEMRIGAFALLDCLGFKGIWQRHPPEKVMAKLAGLAEMLDKECTKQATELNAISPGIANMRVQLLSDTIAVSHLIGDYDMSLDEKRVKASIVGMLCTFVSRVVDSFLVGDAPLLLRGCVTYGAHVFEKQFIMGPAVDQAAEFEKLPNGAFVWFAPPADAAIRDFLRMSSFAFGIDERDVIRKLTPEAEYERTEKLAAIIAETGMPPFVIEEYPMPIKGGERLRSTILNPFATRGPDQWDAIRTVFSREMSSDRIDVRIKRQNTLEFLDEALRRSNDFQERLLPVVQKHSFEN